MKSALPSLTRPFDVVLIDCAPTLNLATSNALAAADGVLVPIELHFMALSGLAQLLQTMQRVKDRLNPHLRLAGIIPCRTDLRTRHAQGVYDRLKEKFNDIVYNVSIRNNIRLAESPSFQKSVFDHDNTSSGADDYRKMAEEFMARELKEEPVHV